MTSPPYRIGWNNVAAGSYTLTAKAYDTLGQAATSAPVHVTVNGAGGGGTSATFVGTDTTTQGSWRGMYGADGYQIVNDSVSYPSYAAVTVSGADTYTWAASTADVRALQQAAGADRIAATWFQNPVFTIDVNLTDGQAHQVALYVVDWEYAGRSQTVEIRDAVSGALLDSRALQGFRRGSTWQWTLQRARDPTRDEYRLPQRGRQRPLLRHECVESGAGGGADQPRRGRDVYRARIADGDGDCLGCHWIARVEFYQASAQGQSTLIGTVRERRAACQPWLTRVLASVREVGLPSVARATFSNAHLRALRSGGHPSPESRAKGGAGYGDRTRVRGLGSLCPPLS